jgi:aromatic ring-opening dioxygenase catalytic subunit (LigB family)
MAVATIPVLGGVTMPPPVAQVYRRLYKGGALIMADGSIVHDLTDATARHSFRLEWVYLNATQLTTVQNAFDGIKNTTAIYVSIRNTSHTVTRPDGGELEITPVVTAAGDIKFNVSMELVEDS